MYEFKEEVLTEREQKVLEYGASGMTYKEIGEKYGICKQTACAIYQRAERKLKHNERHRPYGKIREYIINNAPDSTSGFVIVDALFKMNIKSMEDLAIHDIEDFKSMTHLKEKHREYLSELIKRAKENVKNYKENK